MFTANMFFLYKFLDKTALFFYTFEKFVLDSGHFPVI